MTRHMLPHDLPPSSTLLEPTLTYESLRQDTALIMAHHLRPTTTSRPWSLLLPIRPIHLSRSSSNDPYLKIHLVDRL